MVEITVHSKIASLGSWRQVRSHDSILLWYFARGVDFQGNGKANFSLSEASSILKKSIHTIRSYLIKGRKIGIFRHYFIKKGICSVYYSSRNRVAELLGLNSLGTSVKLRLEELSNLRFYILEGVAKAAQHWGMYAAKATFGEAFVQKTASAVQSSLGRQGATERRSFLFLNSSYQSYATGQAKIAQVLGVSIRTVNRNLSYTVRENTGLPHIPRVQIAIHDPRYNAAFLGRDTDAIADLNLIHPPGSSRVYRLYPCVYQTDIELINTRWQARKYKRYLSAKCRQKQVAGGRMEDLKNLSIQNPVENAGGATL